MVPSVLFKAIFSLCAFSFGFRSSDSDGAFETPESTTPVKAASPTEPLREELKSDDKGTHGNLFLALIRDSAVFLGVVLYCHLVEEGWISHLEP